MKVEQIRKFKTLKYSRLNIGLANEMHYESDIKECFEGFGDITHTKAINNSFDFESDFAVFELKTRMVNKNKYPETIVGYDKILSALEHIKKGKQVFFLFAFLDVGLCYWELTEKNHLDLEVKINGCHIRQERKSYIHIPVSKLEVISSKTPLTCEKYNKLKKRYDNI